MSCPPLEEAMFSPEHLESCASCRAAVEKLEAAAVHLRPDDREFDDPELARDVGTLIKLGHTARRPRRRWPYLIGPALAALFALFFLLPQPAVEDSGFYARTGSTEAADRWVSIEVFRLRGSEPGYEKVDGDLVTTDALLFSLENRPESPYRYAMILAFDEHGETFWYYPAFTDRETNPTSIPAESGPLKEAIEHDLSFGWLRVVGLFSKTPLDVKRVEAAVKRAGKPTDAKRLPIPETGQHTFLLKVEAP